MADFLEGTLSTPVGPVPKKAAALIGGGLLILVIVMYMRGKKQDAATTTTGEINPATGFPFGSPEDLAELASQGGSLTAVGGGGGGGGGDNHTNTAFTTNAQWVQATIAGLTGSGIIEDPGALSVALGKYIGGQPVGDNTTMRSLIEQAIAFSGQPPIAGPNGYPPAINTANAGTDPTPTPAPLPTSATAPAGVNLYDWCKSQGVDFVAVFGDKDGNNALNPGARKLIHWAGPEGSTKIPTFSSAKLLRIR